MLFLWPSSILLLLTDGREDTLESYLIVSASVLCNVALYSFVGAAGWLLRRALTKSR